ncbi:outer membrane biogenesis protein BamB [Thalassoglobus neptunius]|uniref:Outer membrane biogenesis protein BamB n=1 Tax=Thalassoglobus neptunius TaxID=1938619 RepID=A0A5C5X5G1_9PLAN|nr:PQQ-binding-like beta-propeller repeat protein [Thalassoglobus neptunius]TWT58164.1 outer membrane biogenesis protein BamB [Thalassoglobus neptunius]
MKFHSRFIRFLSLAIVLLTSQGIVTADDWPQLLGPNRNGISKETGLIDAFPSSGPKVLWKSDGGVGMSGVVIAEGIACTLVQDDQQQYALALDPSTGKTLWKAGLAPAYKNSMGNGPRATPVIDRGQVFAYTGEGKLCCLDAKSGLTKWSVDAIASNQGKPPEYGTASSPLTTEELVIVTVGTPEATVVAYDRETGAVRWKAGSGNPAGYSSAALLPLQGTVQVVVFHGQGVMSLYPGTGEVLWEYPYETPYDCNIATPIAVSQSVLISAGENHGTTLLQVPKEKGQDVQVVWESLGNRSVLRNEWQTSILHDGKLYGFDNVGSAGPVTHLTCVDAQNGHQLWRKARFGKGNCVAADGKLWCSLMTGELVIVRVDAAGFDELDRATVIGETRQAPAISNGKLYLRDNSEVVCIDISKERP